MLAGGVVALVAASTLAIGVILRPGFGEVVRGPGDEPGDLRGVVDLPPPGQVGTGWLDDATPVFVLHDIDTPDAEDDVAVRVLEALAPAPGPGGVETEAAIWCAPASVFMTFFGDSVFRADGAYAGGSAARDLATFAHEVAGDVVRVGARREGLPRDAHQNGRLSRIKKCWSDIGPGPRDRNDSASLLDDALHRYHSLPDGPAPVQSPEEAADTDGWALVEGAFALDQHGQPRLCWDVGEWPYQCPSGAPIAEVSLPKPHEWDARGLAFTGLFRVRAVDGRLTDLTGIVMDLIGPRPPEVSAAPLPARALRPHRGSKSGRLRRGPRAPGGARLRGRASTRRSPTPPDVRSPR